LRFRAKAMSVTIARVISKGLSILNLLIDDNRG